jgi:adenosylcobyric acid synthase
MPAVMVQGCTSGAGKSLLTTALCRWYADRGLAVAPFKGQNMSNNARVVAGGELGVAQWLQALAARIEPDVRMGPVLVKPERDGSQVVVLGRVDSELSRRGWTERPRDLWPTITGALDELIDGYDLVICEGAGSPAEINLRDTDLANMRVACHTDARVLLVADIDRGGAFAHLHGTWALLGAADRSRLAGFVLNRFRGDPALLRDGPGELTAGTGMPYAGLLPMLTHRLPDEDGARELTSIGPGPGAPVVAVVRYPSASNLDEFVTLATAAQLRWVRSPIGLNGADLIILPGSKHVSADLAWLHEHGLSTAVARAAAAGTRILGICGGLHMLGEHLAGGPDGLEDSGAGLGLLPVVTGYAADKLVERVRIRFADDLPAPWRALAGISAEAYDVRHGRSRATSRGGPAPAVLPEGHGWARGNILGVASHGLLENRAVLAALLGSAPHGALGEHLDPVFDELAAAVSEHLDVHLLERLTGGLL